MTTAGRRTGHGVLACAVLAVTATLAGCAGTGGASDSYDCMGTSIPAETLTDPRPATELDATGRDALAGTNVPPIDPAEWAIAATTPTEVVLLRELAEPVDQGAGDVRTHERMVITLVDAPNLPSSPAWMLSALGTCAITSSAPGAGSATVTLDPAGPPTPGSTAVALLVTERSCNSGEDADGRVELATLRETASTVEVVITVEPRDGGHDCQSNPPTPFTVELAEPLGDRRLLDASTLPPRPITLPTH
ncbi:hypothetical protein [Cellulomonas terrae]|uniref:Lipoprotein n=1 Tax=Cellulomonas terrae TaxID=311234 RepID=A0A511JQM5_9CELL|nr:hypothetical protein [Cellulomonas terrae]GEM00235.1 hypothetical protein CTE05_37810 [Cellulomonas terrae]